MGSQKRSARKSRRNAFERGLGDELGLRAQEALCERDLGQGRHPQLRAPRLA